MDRDFEEAADAPRIVPLAPELAHEATALAVRVFLAFEAQDYPPAGVAEFRRWADGQALVDRLAAGGWGFVAVAAGHVAGVVEVRDGNHLSLLFVDGAWQRRGIARRLFDRVVAEVRAAGLDRLTVHSSRYAVPIYERLGFVLLGPERQVNGIRFVPMAFEVPTGAPVAPR